jgi:TAZ zinc finger
MKYVWSHMQNCEEAECPIPLCDRLADIISHWTKCYVEEDRECPLCTPVKERQTRKNLKG